MVRRSCALDSADDAVCSRARHLVYSSIRILLELLLLLVRFATAALAHLDLLHSRRPVACCSALLPRISDFQSFLVVERAFPYGNTIPVSQ